MSLTYGAGASYRTSISAYGASFNAFVFSKRGTEVGFVGGPRHQVSVDYITDHLEVLKQAVHQESDHTSLGELRWRDDHAWVKQKYNTGLGFDPVIISVLVEVFGDTEDEVAVIFMRPFNLPLSKPLN